MNKTKDYKAAEDICEQLFNLKRSAIVHGISLTGLMMELLDVATIKQMRNQFKRETSPARRDAIRSLVEVIQRDTPSFSLGLNTSYYMPYKGLSNSVRVHHDFIVPGHGEFFEIMPEEDGTFFVPSKTEGADIIHITPQFTGLVLARISATDPTIGRRYEENPSNQPKTLDDSTKTTSIEAQSDAPSEAIHGHSGDSPEA